MNSLGIYEKALPPTNSWIECLKLVKNLGFNFLELSIDESDERLSRLNWTKEQKAELRDAIWKTGTRIHTLMLSGHRRYPLGSNNPQYRIKSLNMLYQAIDFASDIGIRNIQLAGYDVYYENKSLQTRERFIENLHKGVAYAARKEVMLSIETMDDPFLNSLKKVDYIKTQIHSPWLQAYPDLGNLSAWSDNDVGKELELGIDHIVSIHLKDTKPVTSVSKGEFRNIPFGSGTVDFLGCLSTLKRLHYNGAYTIEMWTEKDNDPLTVIKQAKQFFDNIFAKIGIKQEDVYA